MKIQAPKGTRDYYPQEMAWRNFLENAWRSVSVRNGFEEVEGPIFESLDLYKVKSGEGIVSELFHFTDRGDREMAIRPEFTPTLARMVAMRANALPKPIKWFSMPNLCRAENVQRGRLREFLQWNVDMMGIEGPQADAETIFTAVDSLRALGLKAEHVKVKISHRDVVKRIMLRLGVAEELIPSAFVLLDKRDKMEPAEFSAAVAKLGLDAQTIERFNAVARIKLSGAGAWSEIAEKFAIPEQDLQDLGALHEQLAAFGISDWCEYDLGIVRGLAYYTGTVFEVHEATGAERAIAGGGRYDQLIELFDGPKTPAVGFGMGDVVLTLVLQDKGLVPADVSPPVDVFVLAADEASRKVMPGIVAMLRGAGLHTRMSYKTSTNVGKLLKDADNVRARFAVIVESEGFSRKTVKLKNLRDQSQSEVLIAELTAICGKR